jgi:hypothetical protein
MIGIAGGIAFMGYWLFAYGWSQLHSCNAGFFAIGWPGSTAFTGCNPDPSTSSSTGSSATSTATNRGPFATTSPGAGSRGFMGRGPGTGAGGTVLLGK